jgi:hypothetical protein
MALGTPSANVTRWGFNASHHARAAGGETARAQMMVQEQHSDFCGRGIAGAHGGDCPARSVPAMIDGAALISCASPVSNGLSSLLRYMKTSPQQPFLSTAAVCSSSPTP